jgi:hypothetical protein
MLIVLLYFVKTVEWGDIYTHIGQRPTWAVSVRETGTDVVSVSVRARRTR